MPLVTEVTDAERLKGFMSDLVALSTMSAWWIGRPPDEIADSLRDLLVSMLRADEASVKLTSRAVTPLAEDAVVGSASMWKGAAIQRITADSALDLTDPVIRRASVPIGIGGALGRFVVGSRRSDFPDKLELLALEVAAKQVAVAIDYAMLLRRHERAEERLRMRAVQQAAVARLGMRALDGLTLDETLAETATVLRDASHADASAIMELVDDGGSLLLRSAVGWAPSATGTCLSSDAAWECGYALQSTQPTIIRDIRREHRFGPSPALDAEGFLSGAIVVVMTRAGPFGVICTHSRAARELSDDDVYFQQALANMVAVAVDHDRADRERTQLLARTAAAQRTAEQTSHVKSEFLGMMSHELRTPLNAIGGYAQLMEDDVYGPINQDQRAALARIRRAQQYLLSLVNSVLSSLKLRSGQMQFRITDVVIDPLLGMVEELIRPQMETKSIEFATKEAGCDVRVRADEEKLQQVVLNLLSNATKFTNAGGRINLECEVDEREVSVHVSDTGCGIAPEQLATVFEPFVQVDRSASRSNEGTGLGLAISRDLALGMGGRLDARSEVGQGSTFTVVLPRAKSTPFLDPAL